MGLKGFKMKKMWRIDTIHLIYIISFMDVFAVGLTFPLFSTHLRELGASHTVVGLLGSTYSGIQVLSGPFIGGWSDVKDRKSVLKVTLILCALCYCLLGTTNSILLLFILRFILGIVKHTQSICKAVIIDLVPPKDQTAIFGKSFALSSLGFIVGPFIGGILSEVRNGFTYVCLLTALLFLINYGIAGLLPDESAFRKKNSGQSNAPVWQNVKDEFSKTIADLTSIDWKDQWDVFLLKFLNGLTMTTYFSNQSIYLTEKYQLSQKYVGYMISYFSSIGMLSAFFLNKLEKIYTNNLTHYQRTIRYFILLSICFIFIHFSPNLWALALLLIPLSISATGLRVATMELMFEKSDDDHRGSLSGASNSIMSIARFFTPLFTGIASDFLSEQSVMLLAIVPASVGAAVSFYMSRTFRISVKQE